MSSELNDPVVVDFPLRGEWVAYNSPGDRVPSHGTDMLGQRFELEVERDGQWVTMRDVVPRRADRIRSVVPD